MTRPRSRANGEGTVFPVRQGKHKGKYGAAIVLGRRPDGKLDRRQQLFHTRAEADAWLTARKQERDGGGPARLTNGQKLTIESLIDNWLQHIVLPNRAPRTAHSYAQIARLHILPDLATVRVDRLTDLSVVNLLNRKRAEGTGKRTLQLIYTVLHASYRQAVRWHLVPTNPLDNVDRPTTDRRRPTFFNASQARAFLAAIDGHPHEALFTVCLLEGLRQGEALGLQWSAVDLEAETISVRTNLQRIDHRLTLTRTKTESSEAIIPISRLTVDALHRQRDLVASLRASAGPRWQEHDLVFPSRLGTPLEASNIVKRFKDVLQRADPPLPAIRFQDLRHSCATLMIANQENPRVVMEKLRHSDIAVTMNVYAHVISEQQRAASHRMDELLGGKVQQQIQQPSRTNGDKAHSAHQRPRKVRTKRTHRTPDNPTRTPQKATLDQ